MKRTPIEEALHGTNDLYFTEDELRGAHKDGYQIAPMSKIGAIWVVRPMLAWGVILEKAAEACATAIATQVGEAIGRAVIDGLLGNNQAFVGEVLTRLDRIEQRLNVVIDLLRELPGAIDAILTRGEVSRGRRLMTVVKAAIATPISDRSEALHLLKATQEMYVNVYGIFENHPERFQVAIETLALMIAAFSRIVKFDEKYGSAFPALAEDMKSTFLPLVDPKNEASFRSLRIRLDANIREAKEFVTDYEGYRRPPWNTDRFVFFYQRNGQNLHGGQAYRTHTCTMSQSGWLRPAIPRLETGAIVAHNESDYSPSRPPPDVPTYKCVPPFQATYVPDATETWMRETAVDLVTRAYTYNVEGPDRSSNAQAIIDSINSAIASLDAILNPPQAVESIPGYS